MALATTHPDAAVVRALLDGDEAAFVAFVEKHHGALTRFARTFVKNAAVAEEVVQDTWVALLEGLASFEGRSSLKSWLFRVLANKAQTRGVREARSIPFSTLAGDDADTPAVDPSRFDARGHWTQPPTRWDARTPEHQALLARATSALEAAMEKLPPAQRAVVILRDVEGLAAEEACAILEVSEANQRVLLHRARGTLRAALELHWSAGVSR